MYLRIKKHISSVITQKGRISKRVFQEDKARQIFWKTNISYPLIRTRTCAYKEVRNVRFSESLACFFFLKYPFWDSPFCLIILPTICSINYSSFAWKIQEINIQLLDKNLGIFPENFRYFLPNPNDNLKMQTITQNSFLAMQLCNYDYCLK